MSLRTLENAKLVQKCIGQVLKTGKGTKIQNCPRCPKPPAVTRRENRAPLRSYQLQQKRLAVPGSLIQSYQIPRSPKYKNLSYARKMDSIIPLKKSPISSNKPVKSPKKPPTSRLYGSSSPKSSRSPKYKGVPKNSPQNNAQQSHFWRMLDNKVFKKLFGKADSVETPKRKNSPKMVLRNIRDGKLVDMTGVMRDQLQKAKEIEKQKQKLAAAEKEKNIAKKWYRCRQIPQTPPPQGTPKKSEKPTKLNDPMKKKSESSFEKKKLEEFHVKQARIGAKLREFQNERRRKSKEIETTEAMTVKRIGNLKDSFECPKNTKVFHKGPKDMLARKSAYESMSSYRRHSQQNSPNQKNKAKHLLSLTQISPAKSPRKSLAAKISTDSMDTDTNDTLQLMRPQLLSRRLYHS